MTYVGRGQRGINLWGLVVAGVGFFLTRFTVTLAVYDDPLQFLLAGVAPLAAGLAVAAFGVALVVGAFEAQYVRTVALWCLAGTGSMSVLALLTAFTSDAGSVTSVAMMQTTSFSSFLIGGCVGGTVTGIFAARNARERDEQRQQAKRMAVLNRLLRDRVLNAVTVIRGRADLLHGGGESDVSDRALDTVTAQTEDLETTVEEIRHLTRSSASAQNYLDPIDVGDVVDASVSRARERYPDARIELVERPDEAPAYATDMLGRALDRLVENAVEHSDAETPTVEVAIRRTSDAVSIAVSDDGPGLPPEQRRMLAAGDVEEYDDPSVGFGLNVVTLLVESYGGRIHSAVSDDGTTITLDLPAADAGSDSSTGAGLSIAGVSKSRVALAGAAALFAGVVMGFVGNLLTGLIPVIGVLYGVENPIVGWVTHEFHSVVFGVVYVGLLAVVPERHHDSLAGCVAVAVGLGVALWLVAVGVVTPVWLQLVGVEATVPNLSPTALLTHLVWGLTLGLTYALALDSLPRWQASFQAARTAVFAR